MDTLLEIIGAFTIGAGLTLGIWKGIKKLKTVKINNPIKNYIRKVVLEYLQELQK